MHHGESTFQRFSLKKRLMLRTIGASGCCTARQPHYYKRPTIAKRDLL